MNISSVGDDTSPKAIEALVERSLEHAMIALDEAIDTLGCNGAISGREVKTLITDLRRAQHVAIKERQNLQDERRKRGELGDGEIDFGAARREIIDRLARLRNS